MAQRDILNRSLDAGKDVTQRTQDAIESLLRDLARNAEEQTNQAQQLIQELLERSRANTEQIVEAIDKELRSQLGGVGLATKADITRLEEKIEALQRATGTASGPSSAKAPARKTTAKTATAKTATAKTATAKKTTATTATKATAKKATATKATATKAATGASSAVSGR